MSKNEIACDSKVFDVTLYYDFGGSIEWLKDEFIKKRYDSFRYLIPVSNKEKANLTIKVSMGKNDEGHILNIVFCKKIVNFFSYTKVICKDLYLSPEEWASIYPFLKETYIEK